jgi:hypothetical protein
VPGFLVEPEAGGGNGQDDEPLLEPPRSRNGESGNPRLPFTEYRCFPKALPTVGRERTALRCSRVPESRGDCPCPKDNRHSLDIATLAIFPEYVEFDGEDVLKLVVQGEAGRTIK